MICSVRGTSGGVKSLTASATLGLSDNRKTILFTPPAGVGALVVTLPSVQKGLEFRIIQAADYDTAACEIGSAEGNNFVGGILAGSGNGDAAIGADDKISFGSATVAGDFVELVCDGTSWIVIGSRSKATTNGVKFA